MPLILIEAPSLADHRGMLIVGKKVHDEGGDLMRLYTTQHPWYCGIDLHAQAMYVCILNQKGDIVLHRNMQTNPETF